MIAPIFLMGMRGAGKSTIGTLAARSLRMNCIDSDTEFEKSQGMTIANFIKLHGLEQFRQKEFQILQRLCGSIHKFPQSQLVALGGGFVDFEPSRILIQEAPGWRVCLKVTHQTLWERLQTEPERLAIGGLESQDKFVALAEQRQVQFAALADYFISNEGDGPQPALNQLLGFACESWGL